MKDKDPNEDELNKDEQDNINEADDSFGLPDLDFNTLDEAAEEASEEESDDSPDEGVDDNEEETTSEADSEEPEEVETDDNDAEEEEEATPVTRSYVPPKPESNTPKVVAALFITILVSIGVWYFMFYRPQAAAAEKAKIEAEAKQAAAAKKAADAKKAAEQKRLAAEQDTNAAADADEKTSEEATFSTISERTGRYYVIVQSNIDEDMAADKGRAMALEGTSTVLLSGGDKKTYSRLALSGDYVSYLEAQETANRLKGEYGEDLWVLKY